MSGRDETKDEEKGPGEGLIRFRAPRKLGGRN